MRIGAFGDSAVLVELEQRFDEGVVSRARAIADAWEAEGSGDAIPAYASVLLRFDPAGMRPEEAVRRAGRVARARPRPATARSGRLVEIPTRYDGPDVPEVAALSGVTPDELVALHAGRDYTAFFLGFMPGFAYCGRLDPRIVAPRLEVPRVRVPTGSVAVADGQTAVYPFASPGGWRLIGRTDLRLFDAAADRPALIAAGDRVRFVPVA